MTERIVMITLSRLEAQTLADLVAQFRSLLQDAPADDASGEDPALARLLPDAYPDDREASGEFRHATRDDLLARRAHDAEIVQTSLLPAFSGPGSAPASMIDIALEGEGPDAWMRTLAALRLVVASRLGIQTEADAERVENGEDERFAVYDWLGYRLEGLLQAFEAGD